MPRFFPLVCMLVFTSQIAAQQLYVEGFFGSSRTSFNNPLYNAPDWYSTLGSKVAFGFDHLQIGAEYSFNLSKPSLALLDTMTNTVLGNHIYKHTYYGILLRGKISRYPARRFGLTLTAGAGIIDMSRISKIEGEPASLSYGKTPAFNGGIGLSIPTQGMGMVEFGYTYYYVDLNETSSLPSMRASYYSFHIGYSLNFVFGKRAAKYDKIMKF